MKQTTPRSDEVWYVDSGASNHMTSHKEWFSYLEKPIQPGVVATGDDTLHPIANVGEVPLSHVGQKGKLMNVLHVPTITKNLVLCKGGEMGGCSSSSLLMVAPQCS